MYFRVNLKMKKPMSSCCFRWILFIELNFTVTFLLIRKTWDEQFASKVWRMGDFKKWGRGMIFERGGDTPLQTMHKLVVRFFCREFPYSIAMWMFCFSIAGTSEIVPYYA